MSGPFTVTGGTKVSGTPANIYIYKYTVGGTIKSLGENRTVNYYLVGGGGGGGAGDGNGAGGGAGGGGGGGAIVGHNSLVLTADTDFTINIGAGGPGGIAGGSASGGPGAPTSITDIVGATASGGGGGSPELAGIAGTSGGTGGVNAPGGDGSTLAQILTYVSTMYSSGGGGGGRNEFNGWPGGSGGTIGDELGGTGGGRGAGYYGFPGGNATNEGGGGGGGAQANPNDPAVVATDGGSGASGIAYIYFTAPPPPDPPTAFSMTTSTSNSVTLAWTPAAGTDITYQITVYSDSGRQTQLNWLTGAGTTGGAYTSSPAVIGATDITLTAGTTYYYSIVSVKEGVSSAVVEANGATTPAPMMPMPPTGFNSTSTTANSISLAWTAPAFGITPTRYQITVYSNVEHTQGLQWNVGGSGGSYTGTTATIGTADITLSASTTYHIGIVSVAPAGNSQMEYISVATGAGTSVSPPTAFRMTAATTTSMTFAWTAPTGTGFTYRMNIYSTVEATELTGPVSWLVGGANKTFTGTSAVIGPNDVSLVTGTTYYFKLVAVKNGVASSAVYAYGGLDSGALPNGSYMYRKLIGGGGEFTTPIYLVYDANNSVIKGVYYDTTFLGSSPSQNMILNVDYRAWWQTTDGGSHAGNGYNTYGASISFFYRDTAATDVQGNTLSYLDTGVLITIPLQFSYDGVSVPYGVNYEAGGGGEALPGIAETTLRPAGGLTFTSEDPVPFTIGGPVCFAAGTPVLTDQGYVAIDLIEVGLHTISGKQIVSVTKGVTDATVVLIKKDCLGAGKPVLDTVITSMHQVLFRGRMTKACDLPGVNIVPWDGQHVYNVELETLDTMMVNNLIVETAYPKTALAALVEKQILKCARLDCNFLQHADIKNNGGTHCCLNCKAGSGEHGAFCMKLEI